MVIDTSALIAVLLGEPERDTFQELIARSDAPVMSVVSVVEVSLVLHGRRPTYDPRYLDDFLQQLGIEVVSVDAEQGKIARDAFRRFGRGQHPARLNFGDCFSYAAAKASNVPLLFKGEDFSRTDVHVAWRPTVQQ